MLLADIYRLDSLKKEYNERIEKLKINNNETIEFEEIKTDEKKSTNNKVVPVQDEKIE